MTAQLGQRGQVIPVAENNAERKTVLDMRGSTPLSRSMKKIKVTMKEIYDAMRPSVQRNKKKYTRKTKHKNEKKNFE